MAAEEALGRQWPDTFRLHSGAVRQEPGYPTKGYRKAADKLTAQQRLMGAGRGYDVHTDVVRKGIEPSPN